MTPTMNRTGFRQKATCLKCHRKVAMKDGTISSHIAPGGQQRCYPGDAQVVALPRQKRMKPGRKSELELKIEARLKAVWQEAGLPERCEAQLEGCAGDNLLSWAHVAKRRSLTVEEYLCGVSLLCIPCHGRTEALSGGDMREMIEHYIQRRGWRPTVFTFRDLWPELASYFGGRWIEEIEPIVERGM